MYILKKKKGAQKLKYQNAAKNRTEKNSKEMLRKKTENSKNSPFIYIYMLNTVTVSC